MKTFRIRFIAVTLFAILTLISLVTPALTLPGVITIKGRLDYVNEWGGLSPMRRVKVYLMDNDMWEGSLIDETVAWQYTDNAGNYEFIVGNDDGPGQNGRDPYIKVESSNPVAVAMSLSAVIYTLELPQAGTNVPDGFFYNYGSVYPDVNNEAWQAIDAALSAHDWMWTQVGWERLTRVTIYWSSGSQPRSYGDAMHLPSKSLWAWDHVEVYHQYALCVLYTLYGNRFPSGYPGPLPPQRVFFESSGPFALVEGWASFIQCAVDNNPNNLVDSGNIETNSWFNIVDAGDMDGEIIEGSVASVLWDIFDPANDDPLSLGFGEIFYTMKYYKPADFGSFWNWWRLGYPAYQGDLSTICWMYGINRDFYPPTGSILINGGAAYTTSTSVTLTVSASDYGSGVAYMRFANLPDVWFWGFGFPELVWSPWYPYATSASWILSSGEGLKTVYAQFMDRQALMTPSSSLPTDTIILDMSPPTASILINDGDAYTTSTSVTLKLTYSTAPPGVDVVRYRNDGEAWSSWEPPSTTKAWTLGAVDGTRTVYYQIRDNNGLVSEVSDTIVLDRVPPTGFIIINAGDTYTTSTTVTLSLTSWDSTSGVDQVRYMNDGEAWSSWQAPQSVKQWTLRALDGTRTAYFQIRDKAGWPSLIYSDNIILDRAAPQTTIHHSAGTVWITRSDIGSGIAHTYYRIDSGSWIEYTGGSFSVPGTGGTRTIDAYSVDNAGNHENPQTLRVHYLSITAYPPEMWSPTGSGWFTEGATASIPSAPGSVWKDRPAWSDGAQTLFTFSTWKKDGVVVPTSSTILMDGPHHLVATYFGFDMIFTGYHETSDDYVLHIKLRLVTGDTQYVNSYFHLYVDIDDMDDEESTTPLFTGTLPGGLDITVGPFDLPIPKSITVPSYVDYVRGTLTLWAKDETDAVLSQSYLKVYYG